MMDKLLINKKKNNENINDDEEFHLSYKNNFVNSYMVKPHIV